MKKTTIKIFSIVLTVMLLFSAMPLNVSAAEEIGAVSVLDVDAPVEGREGDYAVYIPSSYYTIADMNNYGYENGIKWEDKYGNILEPGVDKFRAGVSYTVTINLVPIESNVFNVINATINDEAVAFSGNKNVITLVKSYPAVEDSEDIHMLTFDYGFDNIVKYSFCRDGEIPDTPEYIENGNLILFDWYTNRYFTEVFDINAPVYDDATIYARYIDPSELVTIYMYTDDPEFPFSISDGVIGDYVNVAEPTYEDTGMFFTGWYADPQLTTEYNFSQRIEGYVYLYARLISYDDVATVYTYMPDEYFYSDAYEVEKGCTAYIPEPYIEEMYFDGWFYDRDYTQPFDSDEPITEDILLFAKFIPYSEMHVVSIWLFEGDEYPIASVYAKDGDIYDLEDPAREGMIFVGWYAEPEKINKIDLSKPVTSDLNLYAKFVPEYILGDANSDSTVDVNDVTDIQRYIAKYTVENFNKYAADIDGYGKINITDATMVQLHLAGFIEFN